MEISPLDIEDKKLLESFIKDCEILIHCGIPFRLDVEDPFWLDKNIISRIRFFGKEFEVE